MQEEWRKTTTEASHSPFSFLSPSLASFFFATISLSSAWGGSMKRTRRTRTCHSPPLSLLLSPVSVLLSSMALLLYLASNEPDDMRARAPDRF